MGKSKITNDQILILIEEGKTMKEICSTLKVCKTAIRKRLRKLNINLPNNWNRSKFNENIFDVIDTEEKAYWIGFIFADGYISSSNYTFEISLSIKDIEHLNKFNIFMQYEGNNIKVNKTNFEEKYRCRWTITNKHLWNTLYSYGCVPRKSLILEFPPITIFKDKSLINHFIRGYWDGDGSVMLNKKDKLVCSVLGTKNFLSEITKYTEIPRNILGKYDNTYCLIYQGKLAIKLCDYLYNNAKLFLERKYNRYKFAVLQSNL